MTDQPKQTQSWFEVSAPQLEEELVNFDRDWTPQRLAEIAGQFVNGDAEYRKTALTELVKVDLEQRWKRGDRRLLEAYLVNHPELGDSETVMVELIFTEYEVRRQFQQPADLNEFAQRFPGHVESLHKLILEAKDSRSPGSLHNARETANFGKIETSHHGNENPDRPNANPPITETAGLPAAALPNQFGDRYEFLKALGAGAMGQVFLARDKQLDRKVALKMSTITGEEAITRFELEAKSAAQLNHQSICTIYDFGHFDGKTFITMEFVEGQSLEKYLSKNQLSERKAMQIVGRLAIGLAHAHEHHVVHRDMKPDNVMMDKKGHPHIMDFGLALQSDAHTRRTSDGIIMGTPAYMSPEQVEAVAKNIGPLVDVYALGVMLYEMLTGQLPFCGDLRTTLNKILTETPQDPLSIKPELNPELTALCLQMMAKDSADRPQSLTEVAKALHSILKNANQNSETSQPTGALDSALQAFVAGQLDTHEINATETLIAKTLNSHKPKKTKKPLIHAHVASFAVGALLLLGIIIIVSKKDGSQVTIKVPDAEKVEIKVEGEKPAPVKTPKVKQAEIQPDKNQPSAIKPPPGMQAALHFDGNDYVQINDPLYPKKAPLTIEAIVRPASTLDQSMMGNLQVSGVGITIDAGCWKLWYRRFAGDRDYFFIRSDEIVEANKTVHVAGIFDGDRLWLYINGKRQQTPNSPISHHHTAPYPFFIGAESDKYGRPEHKFKGDIYAMRFSNTARYKTDFTPPTELTVDSQAYAVYDASKSVQGKVLKNLVSDKYHGDIHGATISQVPVWSPIKDTADNPAAILAKAVAGQLAYPSLRRVATLEGHTGWINDIAFTPDGTRLASGASDVPIIRNRFTPRADNVVRIWDLKTQKTIRTFQVAPGPHNRGVHALGISKDGKQLVGACCYDYFHKYAYPRIFLWNLETGARRTLYDKGNTHAHKFCAATFSPDDSKVTVAVANFVLMSFNATDGKAVPQDSLSAGSAAVAFSEDRRSVLYTDKTGGIAARDLETGATLWSYTGFTKSAIAIVAPTVRPIVLASAWDHSIRAWDRSSGKQLFSLTNLDSQAWSLTISPDGNFFAAGWDNGRITLHSTATGKELFGIDAHTKQVTAVEFSPTQPLLASSGRDGKIHLWETASLDDQSSKTKGLKINGKLVEPEATTAGAVPSSGKWVIGYDGRRETAEFTFISPNRVRMSFNGKKASECQVVFQNGMALVRQTHNNSTERWTVTGDRLLVEHWYPRAVKVLGFAV